MTRLLMIRHAETRWNREGRIQGLSDIPIDDDARREVKLWQIPIDFPRDHWISSPLIRARETAKLMGANPIIDNRLLEMDWGEWEGDTIKNLRRVHGAEMEENENRGLDFNPPGGGSPRKLQEQLRPMLLEIAEKGKDVIAITHKGVIRAVISLAIDWNMLGKAPVKVLSGSGQLFEIDGTGKPSVIELNLPLKNNEIGD